MKDFEILGDENKVILSPNLLEKIKYLIKRHPFMGFITEKSIDKTELKSSEFFGIYEDILDKVREKAEYYSENDPQINDVDEILYNEVVNLSKKVIESKSKGDYSNVEELINLMFERVKAEEKMFLFRDLKRAKDDCIIDMRYYMDENTIAEFNRLYSEAFAKRDILRLKELVSKVQSLNLEEWKSA